MTKLNRKGFISLEAFLIVMALAIIGGAGYFVYNAQNKTKDTLDQATKAAETTVTNGKKTASDPTAQWKEHQDTFFSFKYPASWTKNACDQNFVLLGSSRDTAGLCRSDATAQIYISAVIGDQQSANKLSADSYSGLKHEIVTVNGVKGTKESGTLNTGEEVFVGPPNGSKVVQYVFYDKGKTYVMNYTQTPDFPDVLSDFQLIITKTFKFQ